MSSVTLAQASTIVDVALKTGRARNMKPLAVIVLDAGGHPVAYKREDKSSILRFQICQAKAYGSLGMGFGSRGLFERAQKNALFMGALAEVAEGKMMPVPGGVLIQNAHGETIGAVGISGDNSDNDELAALAGIEAAGLKGNTGAGHG